MLNVLYDADQLKSMQKQVCDHCKQILDVNDKQLVHNHRLTI
ncbi:unnamed protein product [Schistosoma curassoni]|uniref:Zf-AD domain-containing protein n=1 Tax=Schistosoma curassoni TaxID=6186 RepID=A0A183KDW4_9TREM|nr:unnamed protein product [Schistosoma curassoni]